MWLGNELREDFESVSEMRSIKEEAVEEGTTIRELLDNLAIRYLTIAHNIFDIKEKRVYPHIVMVYNDQVISPHIVHEQVLKNGDKITILPMYMGG
jgi:sulfur carrier protein ThiS